VSTKTIHNLAIHNEGNTWTYGQYYLIVDVLEKLTYPNKTSDYDSEIIFSNNEFIFDKGNTKEAFMYDWKKEAHLVT